MDVVSQAAAVARAAERRWAFRQWRRQLMDQVTGAGAEGGGGGGMQIVAGIAAAALFLIVLAVCLVGVDAFLARRRAATADGVAHAPVGAQGARQVPIEGAAGQDDGGDDLGA